MNAREEFAAHYQASRDRGATNAEIAAELGIKTGSLFRRLQRYRIAHTSDATPPPLPPHGTHGRYSYHECRCEDCRAAHAARQRRNNQRRAEKRRQGEGEFEHGYGGYTNWRCRCWVCCDEHAKRMRINHQRRRLAKAGAQ